MATIEDLHSDIIARVLRHMDGPTLAAAGCSSSLLRSLSSDPALWRNLCLSSWPSLRHPFLLSLLSAADHHRAFFSQSLPFTADAETSTSTSPLDLDRLPAHLVSAVDLYHNGTPIFSCFIDTDTSSSWFLTSPFRLHALDRKDPDAHPPPAAMLADEPAVSPEDLTLSWAVIDPETRQAVNVSSRRPVAVERHWYTGTLVRFAVVLRGCAVSAVVTCGEDMGHVREVSLTVEDMDGVSVSGRESLGLLKAAMEGRRRGAKWEKEVKESYEEYLKKKRERREKKARREGMLDLCCTGFGALMFLSFLMLLAFR